jgi:hypothetical protein
LTNSHDAPGTIDQQTSAAAAPGVSYTTDFSRNEAPISEGGAWRHFGLDWTVVDTTSGLAVGTQTGPAEKFDDSYAYLSGFPPDQAVSVVVHKDPKIDTSTQHEVEILLRWTDATHNAQGYECNLAYNGAYAEIVRWNGAYGDFTYITPQGSGGPGKVNDGDVFSAQIIGDTIVTSLNGVPLARVRDSTWSSGNPGIGMFRNGQNGAFVGDYCLARFTATSNPAPVSVAVPLALHQLLLPAAITVGIVILCRRYLRRLLAGKRSV